MGPQRIPVRFVVGLDFGTSTTKCVVTAIVGAERKRAHHLISIDGMPLYPSTIWKADGKLVLGRKPIIYSDCYRSLKVALREGELESVRGPDHEPPFLAWVFLSFVVASIKAQILDKYPFRTHQYDFNRDVEWNMGVPLDGVEEQPQRAVFLRLLHYAVKSDLGLVRTADVRFFMEHYRRITEVPFLQIHEQSGFASIGNCFIFSEAHVAVNSFLHLQGNIEPGLYYVCDVGAGTTDIAFFRYAPGIERQIVFYSSSSTRVGGDDCANQDAEQIRIANPQLPFDAAFTIALERIRSSRNQKDCRYIKVYEKIQEGKRSGFRRAWRKEQSFDHWRKGLEQDGGAAVFGGGSFIAGIATSCFSPIPTGVGQERITPERVILKKSLPIVGMTELHRIAYGLAIPAAEFYESWPTYMVPELRFERRNEYNPHPFGSPYEI